MSNIHLPIIKLGGHGTPPKKIHPQQRKIMKAAGFKVSAPAFNTTNSVVVWRRGDIRVGLMAHKPIGLADLIGRVIGQAEYWMKHKSDINWGSVEKETPKS